MLLELDNYSMLNPQRVFDDSDIRTINNLIKEDVSETTLDDSTLESIKEDNPVLQSPKEIKDRSVSNCPSLNSCFNQKQISDVSLYTKPARVKPIKEKSIDFTKTGSKNITVKGQVVDQENEPLPGAHIYELNNNKNIVVTDINGNFKIVLPRSSKLVASYVGQKISFDADRVPAKIILNNNMLDEVVVIANKKPKIETASFGLLGLAALLALLLASRSTKEKEKSNKKAKERIVKSKL